MFDTDNYKYFGARINQQFFDYEKMIEFCNVEQKVKGKDISFIVPAKGRTESLECLFEHFERAKRKTKLDIAFVLYEPSEIPVNYKKMRNKELNYIHFPVSDDEQFNRALSFNLSTRIFPSKYYIFHDVDLIFDKDFFSKIETYIKENKTPLQTYCKRRVCSLSEETTKKIYNKTMQVGELIPNFNGTTENPIGSTGGSLLISHDLFQKVGGFDPEFFTGYGPEDLFFWEKMKLFSDAIYFADEPKIELFHLHHEKQPETEWFGVMMKIYNEFLKLDPIERLQIIKEKNELYSNL